MLHYVTGGRGHSRRPCRQEVLDGLASRYGLLGRPPATLEEMGAIIGVTRERARQIQIRHESITKLRPWWPQLDAALEIARTMAPCTETALANELARHHLSAAGYSVESLRACAMFAGRSFELEAVDGTVTADSAELTAVLRATRRLSSRQGLGSLLQISDEVLDDGVVLTEEDVHSLLSASSSVIWLGSDHVTWAASARNRLVNTLRTILSVHQPVELATAQKAIANFWSYRSAGRGSAQPGLVPPTTASLRAFCEWHDQFTVTPAGITAAVPLDRSEELGVEAALLVELIRSSPNGALDRVSLMETAEAVGMKLSTVGVYLTFHPAFVQLDRNVWTVRGTEMPPDVVARTKRQARLRAKAENRDFRTGLRAGSRPWVAFAVTSNFRLTGVILRQWLPAGTPSLRLELIDGQGDPCGTATYNDDTGFTHGLGTYLNRFDLRVGEYMHILVNTDEESAQITHGGASLIDGSPANTDLAV
ncbi:MAG: hypothetical protein ACRDRS_18545 [Pseudonocardiaceae bacterium]